MYLSLTYGTKRDIGAALYTKPVVSAGKIQTVGIVLLTHQTCDHTAQLFCFCFKFFYCYWLCQKNINEVIFTHHSNNIVCLSFFFFFQYCKVSYLATVGVITTVLGLLTKIIMSWHPQYFATNNQHSFLKKNRTTIPTWGVVKIPKKYDAC